VVGLQKINFKSIDGKIVDMGAGKYHSVFLTGKIKFIHQTEEVFIRLELIDSGS
jgi:hypothetical protein